MKNIPKISFREDLKKTGFECLKLAELTSRNKPKDHHPYQPHKIDFFAILVITEGTAKHTVDFKQYTLKRNECLIISQSQVNYFDSKSKYKGHLLLFTADFLIAHLPHPVYFKIVNLFNYHISNPQYKLDKTIIKDINNLVNEFFQQSNYFKINIVAALLSIALLKLTALNLTMSGFNNHSSLSVFEKFKDLVEQEYAISRNATYFAQKLHISYKHLNEICKAICNKSAKEFIDNFVILEIKRMLSATTISVKEIGFEAGFNEPTNFLKYFKNITGQTPLEFKQNLEEVRHLP